MSDTLVAHSVVHAVFAVLAVAFHLGCIVEAVASNACVIESKFAACALMLMM